MKPDERDPAEANAPTPLEQIVVDSIENSSNPQNRA